MTHLQRIRQLIVTDETLNQIRDWLEAYAKEFLATPSITGARRSMMELKLDHSRRVAAEARGLAAELGWEKGDQNTAEALGWLHDTGRFSQLAEFGTFRDTQSVNHALRGHQVLSQSGLLRNCSVRRARQILDGVLHHNVLQVPDEMHPNSLAFVRLIRDADKLDIFNVFNDAIRGNHLNDHPEIAHNVDLNGSPTPELVSELRAGRVPSYRMIHSLNDWKLVQVSWAYDLFYIPSCQRALERGVVSRLSDLLPSTPEIANIIRAAQAHLERRCSESAGARKK